MAYWPGIRRSTKQFTDRCDTCCRQRRWSNLRQGKLQSVGVSRPFQRLQCDLTGPHVRSKNGFTYLFTAIDSYTKYLIAVLLRNKSALSVANVLVTRVYLVFGCCEVQINDQGREFENEVMQKIAKLLNIRRCRLFAYRPQSNGVVETVHCTINGMFAKLIANHQNSTSYAPAFLMFARNSTLPVEFLMEHPSPSQ